MMDRRHQLRAYLHQWRTMDKDTSVERFALDADWLNNRLESESIVGKKALWAVGQNAVLKGIGESRRAEHNARLAQLLSLASHKGAA